MQFVCNVWSPHRRVKLVSWLPSVTTRGVTWRVGEVQCNEWGWAGVTAGVPLMEPLDWLLRGLSHVCVPTHEQRTLIGRWGYGSAIITCVRQRDGT
jgi:hypothetical protein